VGVVRFAFLGRVSTEDLQDPVASRQWQRLRALQLIRGHGEIVEEFFDVGQSRAVAWSRRPESSRLLLALRDHGRGFDAVVVGEPQRMFYDSQYALTFPLFTHFGVAVWVPEIGGPVDPDSEAHNLIMSVYAGMSKAERRRIQVRVRASMAAQAEVEGRFLGGRPPYGYMIADAGPHPRPDLAAAGVRLHRLGLDQAAAPVVRRIFDLRLAGLGAGRIAQALNAEGVLCPSAHDPGRNSHRSGAGWTSGTILAIVRNPRYTGQQVWNKQSKAEVLLDASNVGLGTRTVLRSNPREEWVYSATESHPAIITADDFRLAQRNAAPGAPPRGYLLRGLLACAMCGRQMEGAWNNGRANYRCRHKTLPIPAQAGLSASLSVREDQITPHLGAALLCAQATGGVTFRDLDLPRDLAGQAAVMTSLGLTPTYHHADKTLSVPTPAGPATISLR
jgi:DNA invertase Pin-like site-specific DNA recombinase